MILEPGVTTVLPRTLAFPAPARDCYPNRLLHFVSSGSASRCFDLLTARTSALILTPGHPQSFRIGKTSRPDRQRREANERPARLPSACCAEARTRCPNPGCPPDPTSHTRDPAPTSRPISPLLFIYDFVYCFSRQNTCYLDAAGYVKGLCNFFGQVCRHARSPASSCLQRWTSDVFSLVL